ncbi:MAG TPA: hypothetical protein VMN58_03545 [Acidimicrobiales bacterium]|nr:hypothetical protein [Acidimicrobiales bacterium]
MRRLLTALLGASLVLGACGDDDDNGDRAAVTSIPDDTPSSTAATTEPRTVAPDVIPQDVSLITEEYVEQVLNELLVASLEATKHTRGVGLVDETTIEIVESLNSRERSTQALNSLIEASSAGFQGFKDDLRPTTADVSALLEASTQCVFAEVSFDNSGLLVDSQPLPDNVRSFARLVPATDTQRESGLNETAWMIDALPATEDGSVPPDTCPAS